MTSSDKLAAEEQVVALSSLPGATMEGLLAGREFTSAPELSVWAPFFRQEKCIVASVDVDRVGKMCCYFACSVFLSL